LLPEAEVTQDAFDHGWAVNQGNNPHLLLAFRTEERIDFPHLFDEFAPFLGRDARKGQGCGRYWMSPLPTTLSPS
jgi:hypothetical protein